MNGWNDGRVPSSLNYLFNFWKPWILQKKNNGLFRHHPAFAEVAKAEEVEFLIGQNVAGKWEKVKILASKLEKMENICKKKTNFNLYFIAMILYYIYNTKNYQFPIHIFTHNPQKYRPNACQKIQKTFSSHRTPTFPK